MKFVALAALLCAAAGPALAQPVPSPFMPFAVSSDRNEYNLSRSDNGRIMVFARSDADFRGAKIMVSARKGQRWMPPRAIEFSDDRWRDSDPWLTHDGRRLYFVSDRPTAARPDKKDLDIWRSIRKNGRWQPPEHLGDIVNGAGDELGPELHGALYFATGRRSGMGGLDIYKAEPAGPGFGKPELLPAPINSAASESDFTLSRDGRTALFWRIVGDRGVIHLSRREPGGGWSVPVPLSDTVVNIGPFNFTPALSADGRQLSFASTRARADQAEGMADIFELPLASALAATNPG